MSVNPGVPVAVALALLLGLTMIAYAAGRLPLSRTALLAAARALGQLSLAALVITAVVSRLWASVLLLVLMFAVAVLTTVRRVEAGPRWPWASVAMATGLLPTVAVILGSRAVPITGIALIPVVGILLGNTMNAHTLVGRRCFAALREEHGVYEACLSIGLTRHQAIGEIVHRRVPEALIPGLDQVKTAGVVTLPGAFIGVMLGGGSPAQAATAQLLVPFGIMAAQTITAAMAEELLRRKLLVPDDLSRALIE